MFINVASTHNPITGEVNPGCDDSPIENHKTGRRHVAITSSESGVLHYISYCDLKNKIIQQEDVSKLTSNMFKF